MPQASKNKHQESSTPTIIPERLEMIEAALGVFDHPVAPGLCQCGCGETAPIARRSSSQRGYVRGQSTRFMPGHNKRLIRTRGISVSVSGCWVWTGRTDANGYGRVGTKSELAHRIAYRTAFGDFDSHLFVCHTCDNPPCVNPAHLFLGDAAANNRDRHSKGRSKNLFASNDKHPARIRQGEQHWCARLSVEDVRCIRRLRKSGQLQAEIATQFGVHPSTISRIARGEWRTEVA